MPQAAGGGGGHRATGRPGMRGGRQRRSSV